MEPFIFITITDTSVEISFVLIRLCNPYLIFAQNLGLKDFQVQEIKVKFQ